MLESEGSQSRTEIHNCGHRARLASSACNVGLWSHHEEIRNSASPAYHSPMIIRQEELKDGPAIHDVVQAAFGRIVEATLVDQLRADGDTVISLVAVDHASLIGHVMLSRMQAPFKALGLAPVSVRPDRQKSGVGSSLVREVLVRARLGGWDAVFVLGDPRFYRRFGFDPELASRFTSPYAGPHLMVLPLKSGLSETTGRIGYAPAFAALG
jgi:putative acetyltransferase